MGVTSTWISGCSVWVLLSHFGDWWVALFTQHSQTLTNTLPASGLYYLSELVEEHTVFAKKLLSRMIYAVVAIQAFLLLVDGFPIALSALSIGSHIVYYQNLRRFPIVKLTDPVFIVSCGKRSS